MSVQTENALLREQIRQMETRINRLRLEQPAAERDALAAAQTRADSVASLFGTKASAPVTGETSFQYRRRLLGHFAKHSPRFAGADTSRLDATALGPIEDVVYADAAAKASDPASYAPGELRAITTQENGRTVTRYVGDIGSWMTPFMSGAQVGSFNRTPARELNNGLLHRK